MARSVRLLGSRVSVWQLGGRCGLWIEVYRLGFMGQGLRSKKVVAFSLLP